MKIELTEDEMNELQRQWDFPDPRAIHHITDQILSLAAAKRPEPPHWIPVTERMPTAEDGGEVWAWGPEYKKRQLVVFDAAGLLHGAFTHWYPQEKVPEFPKPDTEEEKFQSWWVSWRKGQTASEIYPAECLARHMFNSIRAIP